MVQLPELKACFLNVLGPEQILDSTPDLEFYGKDLCKFYAAKPSMILMPRTIEQVISIVKICAEHKIGLVPSGGRTGYSGGATATNHEVILSLARLNKILEFNPLGQTLRCQAGCVTEHIQNKAKEHGLFYPVDFASKGSSQIGGNIATNAGGVRVIRYGSTRNWVLSLKFVDGRGQLIELGADLIKNQSGYDLKNLIIGSEGTLGIIVEATLQLCKPPPDSVLALVGLNSIESAMQLLGALRDNFELSLFEYFEENALEKVCRLNSLARPFREVCPCYVLVEVLQLSSLESEQFAERLADLMTNGLVREACLAQNSKQYHYFFFLRELISSTLSQHFVPHKNDLSVPLAKLSAFVTELRSTIERNFPDCEGVLFGHLGDGNIHLNILKPERLSLSDFVSLTQKADLETFAVVKKFAGSISAEHGVGLLKKPYLHFSRSERELELMRSIKESFDPLGILNPGKLF